MKTILITLTSCLIISIGYSQPNWRKGGNNAGPAGSPSSIGTDASWNAPLEIMTNGTQKIHINETRTTTIGTGITSFNVNTTGFVGIGPNSIHPFRHPNGVWTDIGPFTLLHLHGVSSANDFAQTWGYRNWMRTGISFTDQTDFASFLFS